MSTAMKTTTNISACNLRLLSYCLTWAPVLQLLDCSATQNVTTPVIPVEQQVVFEAPEHMCVVPPTTPTSLTESPQKPAEPPPSIAVWSKPLKRTETLLQQEKQRRTLSTELWESAKAVHPPHTMWLTTELSQNLLANSSIWHPLTSLCRFGRSTSLLRFVLSFCSSPPLPPSFDMSLGTLPAHYVPYLPILTASPALPCLRFFLVIPPEELQSSCEDDEKGILSLCQELLQHPGPSQFFIIRTTYTCSSTPTSWKIFLFVLHI